MAKASPIASAAVVDEVGARFIGHASSATLTSRTTLALTGERRLRIARQQHDGHPEPLERRQDRQHLVGLARVGQRDHDVAAGQHPDVAVHAFGRVQEVGGRAGRGQSGGDLAPHQARFADAGHHDPAGAAAHHLDGALEALVHLRDDAEDPLGLDAQDTLGQAANVAVRRWLMTHPARRGFRGAGPEHRKIVDAQHVGTVGEWLAVGQRAIRILVHLHEERVHAEGDRRPRQPLHVAALTARAVAGARPAAAPSAWRRIPPGTRARA